MNDEIAIVTLILFTVSLGITLGIRIEILFVKDFLENRRQMKKEKRKTYKLLVKRIVSVENILLDCVEYMNQERYNTLRFKERDYFSGWHDRWSARVCGLFSTISGYRVNITDKKILIHMDKLIYELRRVSKYYRKAVDESRASDLDNIVNIYKDKHKKIIDGLCIEIKNKSKKYLK